MVVSYTRDLLEQLTGARPEPDNDGDLPIEYGGASFYVRIDGPTDPVVQIFSVVLADLEANPDLHGALNDINFEDLIEKMMHSQSDLRIKIEEIEQHPWYLDNYMKKFTLNKGIILRSSSNWRGIKTRNEV